MTSVYNCSDIVPTSDIFFAEISLAEMIGIGATIAVCLAVLILFIDKANSVICHYKMGHDPEIKIKSLWLVGIYPVFAFAALLAVLVPRASLLCDLVSTVYLAVCLFQFTSLIILYSGGIPELLQKAHDTGFSLQTPPCCCCCFCCPPISATWPNLRKFRLMVFQTSFLQPFISFITLVLWLDKKYVQGQMRVNEAYPYLTIVNGVSTLTAMYELLIIFRNTHVFLKSQSITQKFVVLQLVLIFHNLQGFIFDTLAKYDLPPCKGTLSSSVRSAALQHMILVGEMFLLSLLARVIYRQPLPEDLYSTQKRDLNLDLPENEAVTLEEEGGEGDRLTGSDRSLNREEAGVDDRLPKCEEKVIETIWSTMDNCSNVAPYSDSYLSKVTWEEKVCIGIVSFLTLAVLILFTDKVWFILRHYRSHSHVNLVKDKSVWLVGLYPVVALDALLAIYVPRARLLCDFVSTVYLATCLYKFTGLIILYFGGKSKLLEKIRDDGFNLRAPPCCCCCFCCPTVEATKNSLRRVRLLVLQTALLQPVLSFVSVILWLDGKFGLGATSLTTPSTYFEALSSLSTLLAMYGLLVFFFTTRGHLATHYVTPKFLVLQLMLVCLYLQRFILNMLASNNIPPCRGQVSSSVRGDGIQHMLLIAETFLLALGARVVYRKPLMHELEAGERDSSSSDNENEAARKLDVNQVSDKDSLISNSAPMGATSVGRYQSLDNTSARTPFIGNDHNIFRSCEEPFDTATESTDSHVEKR